MRLVTNNRCVAEHIKSDNVEKVATGEVRIGECGKSKRQNLKSAELVNNNSNTCVTSECLGQVDERGAIA